MLGWLKRKTPPVPGAPSRKSEDGDHSGDERLERLLGRLGSEPSAAGQQGGAGVIAAASAPRPEPPAGERRTVEVPVVPGPKASAPPASGERPAADSEEAVLHEIYPPAPALAPAEPTPDGTPPAEATAGGFPPMFVIAVASQKGGAGKTTIAAHLAVRAAIAGQGPVVLIDTDPQGSLAEWWRARPDDTPALAVARPEQLAANLAELRSYGTAVAVIDTPPALTGSIERVIAMADLIVVPVRPSPHDLRAAGGTVEMARRAGKPFLFVVNGAAPRASITAQAIAALSEHGRVAPVILYQRTEYAASMIDGRTVTEIASSGRSAQEIAELWQCISAQIGMRAAA